VMNPGVYVPQIYLQDHHPPETPSKRCISHLQTCQRFIYSLHPSIHVPNPSLPSQKHGLTVWGFSRAVNDPFLHMLLSSFRITRTSMPTGTDVGSAASYMGVTFILDDVSGDEGRRGARTMANSFMDALRDPSWDDNIAFARP
jgi:hypothetical protein